MKYERVNVIRMPRKWFISSGRKIISKGFEHRDQAYHQAMSMGDKVYVHERNGSVAFMTNNKL